jgi:hypothetical protein
MNRAHNESTMRRLGFLVLWMASACAPTVHSADEVVEEMDTYLGQKVVMEVALRSGARCRVGQYEGEFRTYCKDCQYCRGPLVVETTQPYDGADDWPLVLGGVFDGRPIRCEGPLNDISCHPFELGKRYVIRGSIEKMQPPKLLVSDFWEAD